MGDHAGQPTLLQTLKPWPITASLVECLPLSDLLRLARTNTEFRALLHGFSPSVTPRDLRVGQHQTSQWRNLKHSSVWSCPSPRHTKGSNVDYCRQCSDPICEACIVKSSIGKSENTFKNRCRFLCKDCWASDNPHKNRKFTSRTNPGTIVGRKRSLYNFAPGEGEFCNCTSRDGWLCLRCKAAQNDTANSGEAFKLCYGEGCSTPILADQPDKDRRRICIWCDRPMLRGRASMQSRVAFDQRLMDARISVLQDQRDKPDEYNERLWRFTAPVSRRSLRG